MDPATLAALANIAGGVFGEIGASGQRSAAADQLRKIQELYANIKVPTLDEQQLNLNQYQSAGNLNPKMENALQLANRDALQNIQLDPRLKETQMNSLDVLNKIAGKGFTPDELNAAQQMQQKNESDLTSKLKQIQQQDQMRGIDNSGLSLAEKMQEAQSSANRGASNSRDLEAQAFQRSLDAISRGGELAGSMQNQEYGRGLNLANALNQRESTNFNTAENANKSNVDRFNNALQYNLNNNQNISNMNTGTQNTQQTHNKGLYQTQFGNQMNLAGAQAGANREQADVYNQNAARTAKQLTGIGSGVGDVLTKYGSLNKQTPDVTTAVEPSIYKKRGYYPINE